MNNSILYSTPSVRHLPYCDCYFPSSIRIIIAEDLFKLTKCRCGEDEQDGTSDFAWRWHSNADVDIRIKDNEVAFHPNFSNGTAIVRGNTPLDAGMVHFWEMRIITPLHGTDVMFGIGTDQFNLRALKGVFSSALGLTSQSWGYSYNGRIHHDGRDRIYGQKFSQGCIIGIYLDRVLGYLEFFLNRSSLGIAFRNIPTDSKVKIYPMVSSTAARSVIRLMNSASCLETLQFRAMRTASKNAYAMKALREMPGMRGVLRDYWFLSPSVRTSRQTTVYEDIADEAVLGSKAFKRRKCDSELEGGDDDEFDIYSSMSVPSPSTTDRSSADEDEDFDIEVVEVVELKGQNSFDSLLSNHRRRFCREV